TDSIGYNLEATGRSDQAGHYKVGFLPPGSYLVKIEEPFIPSLEPVATPNVQVTAGGTATVSVTLPQAGAGHAYIHISGQTQVGAGGTIFLYAAVGGNNGNPVYSNPVTWASSEQAVRHRHAAGATNVVFVYPCGSCSGDQALGRAPGAATVFATSQGKTGQATITVGRATPVATVTVVPGSASLTGGDNATFTAQLRDAAGNILSNRSVSWSSTDASIVEITSVNGPSATILARAAGLASLRATSEGKTGEA